MPEHRNTIEGVDNRSATQRLRDELAQAQRDEWRAEHDLKVARSKKARLQASLDLLVRFEDPDADLPLSYRFKKEPQR